MILHGLRTLLLAQSSITALVPAQTVNRLSMPAVVCHNAPQGMLPPYVVIEEVGFDPMLTVESTYSETLKSVDIDIDCVSTSEPAARTLAQTVRQFLDDYSGAAGADDTIQAVLWLDESYSYDFPDEGRDVRRHVVTESFQIQYSTP